MESILVPRQQGYFPLTTVLPHIFELTCSFYAHKDRGSMYILVHIPIAKRYTKRDIFERLPLPFIIKSKEGDSEKARVIKASAEFVVTDM